MGACRGCLRRAHLLGHLAPRIAGLLDRPVRRAPAVLALPDEELIRAVAGERGDEAREFLATFDVDRARRELARLQLEAACVHDRLYPALLTELEDPPPVVFFSGGSDRLGGFLAQPSVAVVGTRRPSAYGRELAYSLGRGLGAAGVTVVSGLALGIDAVAHRGCLDAGGGTIAVLANGPDIAYPRANRRLWEAVRETGSVLAEMPPGQRAYRWSFPARNRVMAGLAQLTLVVEAGRPSGSLITAAFAEDLGRVVAAVPGRVTSRMAAGTNALLQDGARLITGAEDVLDELFGVGARPRGPAGPMDPVVESALEPELRGVLEAVEAGLGVEGIAGRAGLAVREVRAALARLEAAGLVLRDGLGSYERAAVP